MSEKDALEAAKAATITHMRGLQTTPPPSDLPDLKTPKVVHTVAPGPDTEMEDSSKVSRMELAAQTAAKAEEILRKAQVLTRQLTKLQQQAAELPGDGPTRINEYIVKTLHLKGKNPSLPPKQTTAAPCPTSMLPSCPNK